MTINAHTLLSSPFLDALTLADEERGGIMAARRTVRSFLKAQFNELSQDFLRQQKLGLLSRDPLRSTALTLKPRFFTQGSFAYETVNCPAHRPPQEVDLDDGMYLPLSIFEKTEPKVASQILFTVVDQMLAELCRQQHGWSLVSDKATCCRIRLGSGAHLDLPLYAIPDGDNAHLVAAAEQMNLVTASQQIRLTEALHKAEFSRIFRLSSDKVWLAHRDAGWLQSDPRQIHEWFEKKVEDHGRQLRRICRFIKAWRDWYHQDSPLASIALMTHVVRVFDDGNIDPSRDDLALLAVAEQLPTLLASPVPNPTNPVQMLDGGLTEEERQHAVSAARVWHRQLVKALKETFNAEIVIRTLREAFGGRIPNRPDLIKIDGGAELVRATAPAALSVGSIPHRSISG